MVIKRNKAEVQRAATHRTIDELFDEMETTKGTCNVTLHLAFSTGGVSGSRLCVEHINPLKGRSGSEEPDYNTRL